MSSAVTRTLCRSSFSRAVVRFYATQKRKQKNRFANSFGSLGGQAPYTERLSRTSFFNNCSPKNEQNPPRGLRENDKKARKKRWDMAESDGTPTITESLMFKREREKRVKKLENTTSTTVHIPKTKNAKVLIECLRPEYNHLEGMRYSRTAGIPIVSRLWGKRYKYDWFIIRRTQKNAPALDGKSCKWEDLSEFLVPQVISNLVKMNAERPTPFQKNSIRSYHSSDHLFIASETGSGKTVVFSAPLISRLSKLRDSKALILVPSAVLRRQSYNMISHIADGTNVVVVSDENFSADSKWNVLVATPGRAVKCLREAKCSDVDTIVMDEADMLMDDSFVSVLTELFSIVPVRHSETNTEENGEGARVIFSSATCEDGLRELAEGIVDSQKLIFLRSKALHGLLPHVEQKFIRVREMDKVDLLKKLVGDDLARESNQTLVFCKDSRTNRVISGRPSELEEDDRVFVGTDVASRGLDLPRLQHVINYDFPRHMLDVLHRFGRVGRCSSVSGSNVTSFVRNPWEVELVNALELAARLHKPIRGIEVNVAAEIQKRKQSKGEEA
ncbi:hypothetical protein QR680_005579 [Steinernema hermaphroditum]|uniref:ATP-dependent RNA helicase n=1 Tax=Steinernema hermaphroditum TaxID=289476 RepID=A0AA39HUW3_9BILA|nr:hypothetical protein QR680_005579 [Steinernema hermaphroditum]